MHIGRRPSSIQTRWTQRRALMRRPQPAIATPDTSLAEYMLLEAALRASEASKAAFFATALDCIIIITHDGRITEFNPAAEQTFGYHRAEVIGQELAELIIPPSFRAMHRDGMARYLATGDGPVLGKRIEITALRADGTEFPIELAITRILIDGPPMFMGFIRDITERKAAEEAQRASLVQAEIIQAQVAAIAALAIPLIPISDQIMVLPLIGAVDSRRAQQVVETLLHGIAEHKTPVAILDITGVPVVDTQVANGLIRAAQAVQLLGAQLVLTGIRPEVAQVLVSLGVDWRGIVTRATLQSGIAYAMERGEPRSRTWGA